MKKGRKRWMIGVLAVVILALLVCDARLKTVIYAIDAQEITEYVRLALVTDLHSCKYGDDQAELLAAIDAQEPDIVLLGGDIFEDKRPHQDAENLLKGLAGRYPCYYVTGNHEYWSREIEEILTICEKYGVKILAGECETITVRGQSFNLCGVDDPDVEKYTEAELNFQEQLKAAATVAEEGKYTVLLSHRPERIEEYLEYGFDLVLSGHAHGGQWRIPGILNGLYAPNQGIFPEYAGGEYEIGESRLIVSRGLARESMPIPRVFNRPELVIVELK